MEITVTGAGGEYMESVVVAAWHKQIGDRVTQGEPVVTVETAKAATEIEATEAGILTNILAQVGEEVSLGGVLGIIDPQPSQTKPATKAAFEIKQKTTPFSKDYDPSPAPQSAPKSGRIMASPLARRVAVEKKIDLGTITPSSPTGRIKLRDLHQDLDAAAPLPIAIHQVGQAGKVKILFLHGFGADSSAWNPLLATLGHQFTSYLVDLPGHGHSYLPKTGLDVGQIAQEVARGLLERDLVNFHLVGHSLGGAVGLALEELAQFSIASLTLLAPAGLGAEINGAFIDGFSRANQKVSLAPWLEKLFFDPAHVTSSLIEATWQARQSPAMRQAQSLMAQRLFPDGTQATNLRHILQKSEVPQKIIWGMQDQILPMHQALNIGGKTALHFLPDIGHMPHYEAPVMVARLLRQNINCARAEED